MITMQESDLLSWKAIWLAVDKQHHYGIQRAIDDHVARFPASEQDLVRLRTIHIVRINQRQTDVVRGHIRRVSSTIRTLQRGRFNPANDETRHDTRSA